MFSHNVWILKCSLFAISHAFSLAIQEGRDKQFLVKQIKELSAEVSRNEQEPELRDSRGARDAVPRWGEHYNSTFETDEEPAMPARDFTNGGFYERDVWRSCRVIWKGNRLIPTSLLFSFILHSGKMYINNLLCFTTLLYYCLYVK